jgi:hypothetical protein
MHVTQWKEPALNWNGTVPEDGRANILEIRSDQFIPDFLQAMGSKEPAAFFNKHRIDDNVGPGGSLKLYQALHGCFYLVTASLVCRQLGLPDKTVNRSAGESVFYVIRRRTAAGEEAWIPLDKGGFWQPLTAEKALTLAPGEERLPMHPVKICPKPETPHSIFTDHVERDLYYGYIPTGKRDKYKDTAGRVIPAGTDAATLVNDYINQVEDEAPASENYSFRKDLFNRRVYLPWLSLMNNFAPGGAVALKAEFATNAQIEQLYIILELGEFLKNNLPTVWAALESGSGSSLPTDMKKLYDALTIDLKVESEGSDKALAEVIDQYKSHFPLVRGQGDFPTTDFDFRDFSEGDLGDLLEMVEAAIDEESQPIQLVNGESSELVQLIKNQVQPRPDSEPLYHIRTVYEYDPTCPPVVSPLPTRPFRLTKFFEPDAPARMLRLEAPSIKPKDLRQFARGVGIEMSPELHKLASCMSGNNMDDVIGNIEDCDDSGFSIQMICSFSIQIIFLVAFIVMFIFLISLNFIFGWLFYLRICLPIPKKS